MGTEAEEVLASFALSDDDCNEYELVKERFQGYFVRRHNPIYE